MIITLIAKLRLGVYFLVNESETFLEGHMILCSKFMPEIIGSTPNFIKLEISKKIIENPNHFVSFNYQYDTVYAEFLQEYPEHDIYTMLSERVRWGLGVSKDTILYFRLTGHNSYKDAAK